MDSGYHTYLRLSNEKLNEKNNLYSCLYVAENGESEEEIEETKDEQIEQIEEEVVEQIEEEVVEQLEPMSQFEELEEDGWKKVGKKEKNKKTNRRHVGLWYNDQSWQYKLVNDLYVFRDTSMSVLEKYDLLYVKKMFCSATNNYKRNNAYHKLMKKITLNEWDIIKDFVEEIQVDKPRNI